MPFTSSDGLSTPNKRCQLNRSMQHHLIGCSDNISSQGTDLSELYSIKPKQDSAFLLY